MEHIPSFHAVTSDTTTAEEEDKPPSPEPLNRSQSLTVGVPVSGKALNRMISNTTMSMTVTMCV